MFLGKSAVRAVPMSDKARDAIVNAVREEIEGLCKQENFGARQLKAIEALAGRSRQLVADLVGELKSKTFYDGGIVGPDPEDLYIATEGGMSQNAAMAGSSMTENYGAKLMRELVPLLTQLLTKKTESIGSGQSAEDLVQAIILAEQAGKTDLSQRLREVLVQSFPTNAASAPALPAVAPEQLLLPFHNPSPVGGSN